ncbi:unnamed protein product [Arabidopsis halleri]
MLLAWFNQNLFNSNVRCLTFSEISIVFTWNNNIKKSLNS